MKTSIPSNNFISGQIDEDVSGRIDSPLYAGGGKIVKNFYATIYGNLLYRTGFEHVDAAENSAIYEFSFNEEQSYLLVFGATKIKFWSYTSAGVLVEVLDGSSNPLEVAHPYGADRFDLQIDQKGDKLYIVHKSYEVYTLTRTAANAFTLAKPTLTGRTFPSGKYPQAVAFYEGRIIYAVGTKIYGSKSATYDNLTIGTGASDGFSFDIAEISSPIQWLYAGKNSLIAGTVDGIVAINGGAVNYAITPTSVNAKLSSNEGSNQYPPIEKDGYLIYGSQDNRRLFAFKYDILSESFNSAYLNKASYNITKDKIKKIVYKQDKYNFMYIHCGNDIIAFHFDADEGTRTLTKIETNGEVKDIQTVTTPNGNSDLFICVKRGNVYSIERLADYVEFTDFDSSEKIDKVEDIQKYQRLISEELKGCVFLDASLKFSGYKTSTITYSGLTAVGSIGTITSNENNFASTDIGKKISYKTETGGEYGYFLITDYTSATEVEVKVLSTITEMSYTGWYLYSKVLTGLTHLANKEVSVVADGGYVGEYTVTAGGELTLDKYVSSAVIGLKYQGLYKSFNYGLVFSTINTQTSPKTIFKFVLRLIKSAGGKIGTDLYNMLPIQKFNANGLYDNPPLPIDNDEEVVYNSGGLNKEKRLYIVQDEPLPLHITMVVPYFKQVNNT